MFTLQSPTTRRLSYMRYNNNIWGTACSRSLSVVTVHVCYWMLPPEYDAYFKVKCVFNAFLFFFF